MDKVILSNEGGKKPVPHTGKVSHSLRMPEEHTGPPLALMAALVIIGGVLLLSLIVFFTTFIDGMPGFFAILLSGSVVFVFFLSILVAVRLIEVWRSRRVGIAGSRMHTRLVGLLSIVAIFPTMIAFVFSAVILQQVSQDYFAERIDRANGSALKVANTYFNSVSTTVGQELSRVALDLNFLEKTGRGIEENPIGFRQYLLGQAFLRNWAAVYLLDGDRKVITSVVTVPGVEYKLPKPEAFAAVDAGDSATTLFHFSAQDPRRLNLYFGMLKISAYEGGYLIAYKGESPVMSQALLEVREFRDSNSSFKKRLNDLTLMFMIGYGLLGLIILLSAVWAGLQVANAIVAPVRRLAIASELISQGDLAQRVEVRNRDGELGDLAQAFNYMTSELETQRDDLISANQQAEQRRAFIETVVSGVSAGVAGVNAEGRISIVNERATELFGKTAGRLTGANIREEAPEIVGLFDEALASPVHQADGQVELSRGNNTRIVNVRISGGHSDGELNYVITLDDITELISAQRSAAWGDVARRIAHEIKNPLTPIQLSAERLQRKYGNEIKSDREVFDRCTQTIIRHVSDIGRMVNEFSSFARMPEPVMGRENVREIVKGALFPFQVANPDISFETNFPEDDIFIHGDGRLLVQACTNLIKNACESIEDRLAGKPGTAAGKIRLELLEENGQVRISVTDNGLGLPPAVAHRLTEPYMTTRKKGTGLGLAIVRKVIEEHNGRLELVDDLSLGKTGARVSIILPQLQGGEDHSDVPQSRENREHA